MYFATKPRRMQILVWLIWVIVCLVFIGLPEPATAKDGTMVDHPTIEGIVTHDSRNGSLFPWLSRHRWRKWAWRRYCVWRRAHRRAVWMAHLAKLALTGALTLAQLVDLITQSQLRRHLGALPALYALLEILRVREIIDRHCPTAAEVDHGTVAMVLVLNRLMAPRPDSGVRLASRLASGATHPSRSLGLRTDLPIRGRRWQSRKRYLRGGEQRVGPLWEPEFCQDACQNLQQSGLFLIYRNHPVQAASVPAKGLNDIQAVQSFDDASGRHL